MRAPRGFGWDLTRDDLVMQHLGYAADQVQDLLPFVTGEQQVKPEAVAAACIDSFAMNVRLIADFFRSNQDRDVHPQDIVPGFRLGDALYGRLGTWHMLASQHAMHMSKKRVSEDPEDAKPVTADDFRAMADDALTAYRTFLECKS